MWRRVFWYFATNVLKTNVEDPGSRFFQNSGTLLQKFQRKLLKMQTAVFPKFWCIATNVSKENAEDADSSSSKILMHCHKCFKGKC